VGAAACRLVKKKSPTSFGAGLFAYERENWSAQRELHATLLKD
jgi:hypothetical protein